MSLTKGSRPGGSLACPIIFVQSQGGLANRMIQYMAACRIASEVPGCAIAGCELDEWGIRSQSYPQLQKPDLVLSDNQIDVPHVVTALSSGDANVVHLNGYAQWMSNFPDLDTCRSLFPEDKATYPGFGPDYLVCNIRGSEILDARHRDYVLLPVDFYEHLAATTGLQPVFMGQIEENAYCKALRSRFPQAIFQSTRGALADFQTFRNAHNLVPSVSTFSWLAAWLSHAATIFLAVDGLFHPLQSPRIDLLPFRDPRYRFYLFPINYAVPVQEFARAHRAVSGNWRYMRSQAVAALRSLTPKRPRRLVSYLKHFDELFYLQAHPDVARDVEAGNLSAGRDHYIANGFAERRICFEFDENWYAAEYPLAALEVGRGNWEDLRHHFVETGATRGYKPAPVPRRTTRWPLRPGPFLRLFDEDFYLRTYPDVAQAVKANRFSSLYHFANHGFKEGRICFPFDEVWYATQYPSAVSEVAQGHYIDLRHHFVETGFYRGYEPLEPQTKDRQSG
jgi:hypothetical protein